MRIETLSISSGVEVRDAVAAIAVPGIGHTAYGRVGLLGGRIENGHTVDHIERLVVAGDRPHAADAYLGRSAAPDEFLFTCTPADLPESDRIKLGSFTAVSCAPCLYRPNRSGSA